MSTNSSPPHVALDPPERRGVAATIVAVVIAVAVSVAAIIFVTRAVCPPDPVPAATAKKAEVRP